MKYIYSYCIFYREMVKNLGEDLYHFIIGGWKYSYD